MPRERSLTFLLAGMLCILVGSLALAGAVVPVVATLRWLAPALLLGAGVAGLVRWWPRSRRDPT